MRLFLCTFVPSTHVREVRITTKEKTTLKVKVAFRVARLWVWIVLCHSPEQNDAVISDRRPKRPVIYYFV